MVKKCAVCGKFVSLNSTLAICTNCKSSVHYNCVKITSEDIKNWKCNKCETMAKNEEIMALLKTMNDKLGKLDVIEKTVQTLNEKYDQVLIKLEKNEENVNTLKNEVEKVKQENVQLKSHINNLEQHGRNKNIEIHNYPMADGESVDEIVSNVARAMDIQLKDGELLNCHRLGKSIQGKPPPAIIAAFNSSRVADRFLQNKKKKDLKLGKIEPNTPTPHTEIYINTNLTRRNRDLFLKMKKKCKEENYARFWQAKGLSKCRKAENSEVIVINLENDLEKIV